MIGRRAFKDRDTMSDTGGSSKHYETTDGRPPRNYEKNPQKEKMQTDETRDDMSLKDPDLKVGNRHSRFDKRRNK